MYTRLAALIALIIFAIDLSSKWYVSVVVMTPPRIVEVFPFLNLVLGYNRGVSFGLLSSDNIYAPYLLSGVALAIVVVLLYWLRRSVHIIESIGFGAITGGALANIVDRLEDGAVTDFLDFFVGRYHWPAFNIADSAILLGVFLIALDQYFLRIKAPQISSSEG